MDRIVTTVRVKIKAWLLQAAIIKLAAMLSGDGVLVALMALINT